MTQNSKIICAAFLMAAFGPVGPAPAQTSQSTPLAAVPATKADVQAARAQISQKIDAQAADIAALRGQIEAMLAQVQALDRELSSRPVPAPPAAPHLLPH
jgi:membrane-bound lytic murein transglycosylase B